ncbi:aspartyl/asparaginyl beta-hydroxylase domain-containing protein [Caedibacter taeniospiralis]|uniref:aspartyl/asparaginyl beta-hydroxylase domain-containing protein n=1 Tax=Caedibacter taeniospiralis TaxID=28907 RepID=UPI000C27A166|nr:aspartyl/asparaginyl beta-hydroxylase domain-containing protein [Caedibacter taeniospiralis]
MKGSISKNSAFFRSLLNALFLTYAGWDRRPPFLDSKKVFPDSKILEDHFDEIKEEIDQLVSTRNLTAYKDIDPIRAKEVSENWKLYYVSFMWQINPHAQKDCPKLLELIKGMPDPINVTIAVLEPGVCLAAHQGPYAGILRYHLGITIPKNNPPFIRVSDKTYTWKMGESIIIDDRYDHEVTNHSDSIRVILMVDIMRPMPFPLNYLNKKCLLLKKKWSTHIISKSNID